MSALLKKGLNELTPVIFSGAAAPSQWEKAICKFTREKQEINLVLLL